MTRVLRCASLTGGLLATLACGTEHPTAPSAIPGPPTVTQPPVTQPPGLPPQRVPLGNPVAIYVYSGPLEHASRGFTMQSQYLLFDNGVFGLRYDAFVHTYLGTYGQHEATITFRFDGARTGAQGIATGTLKGDLLEIRYSDIMVHSDFENAIYRRSP